MDQVPPEVLMANPFRLKAYGRIQRQKLDVAAGDGVSPGYVRCKVRRADAELTHNNSKELAVSAVTPLMF